MKGSMAGPMKSLMHLAAIAILGIGLAGAVWQAVEATAYFDGFNDGGNDITAGYRYGHEVHPSVHDGAERTIDAGFV